MQKLKETNNTNIFHSFWSFPSYNSDITRHVHKQEQARMMINRIIPVIKIACLSRARDVPRRPTRFREYGCCQASSVLHSWMGQPRPPNDIKDIFFTVQLSPLFNRSISANTVLGCDLRRGSAVRHPCQDERGQRHSSWDIEHRAVWRPWEEIGVKSMSDLLEYLCPAKTPSTNWMVSTDLERFWLFEGRMRARQRDEASHEFDFHHIDLKEDVTGASRSACKPAK